MHIKDITHRHLKMLLQNGNPDAKLLAMELDYSTLIAPTFSREGMDFLYLMGDEKDRFIPLFTDMAEYNEIFAGTDFVPHFNDFDYYLSAGTSLVIDAMFKINLDLFKDMPDTPVMPTDFTRFTLSIKELNVLAQGIKNHELLSILQNSPDEKKIFETLQKSTLLIQIMDKNPDIEEGIFRISKMFENVVTSNEGYLELYSSKEEMEMGDDLYVQVVNLNHFFEYIIRLDLDGFILNPNSNHVVIGRDSILKRFDNFKKEYDDSKYALASDYAFEL